jgi:hypothetical protein
MLNIVVLFLMTVTTNQELIVILKFLQGPLTLLEGCILLPILMSQIKSKNNKFIAYSILYGFMLTSDKFATSFIKFAIQNYNHNMMIYVVIMFHIVALLIYLFLFNHNRMFPKMPLYQLNLPGIFILMISLISGAYFFVYGKKYEWFDSPRIIIAFSLMLIFGALFFLYQKTAKRPMYNFVIFRSERVVFGVVLFLIFYLMKSSMSNLYQVMASVWKWHWEYVLEIQYFNVLGSILGIIMAFLLMIKKVEYRYIFALGFFLLAASLFWFSFLFYPDTSVEAIAPPLILEGIAQGTLFTPLVMYMMGSVHPSISSNVGVTGTAIRFWGTTIGFSLMQNLVLYFTTKHQLLLSNSLDLTHPLFQEQWDAILGKNASNHINSEALTMSAQSIKSRLINQALLLSNIEIYRGLSLLGIITFVIVLGYQPIKKKWFLKS